MATNTTNLNLIKPSGSDKIRIAQINQNMDILDEKIGPVGSTSLQAQMSTVTGYTTMSNGTNLNTLTNKANYMVGNISQMLNAPTGAGTSGFFYVEKNSTYILQRFWGNLDKAYRFSYDNGSTWLSWVVHKTQIDSLNSYISVSKSVSGATNSEFVSNLAQAVNTVKSLSDVPVGTTFVGNAEWAGTTFCHFMLTKVGSNTCNVHVLNGANRDIIARVAINDFSVSSVSDIYSNAYMELLHTTSLTNGTGELCIYRIGKVVHIDFTVSGITDNTIIGYLPTGYGVSQRGCFGALTTTGGKAGWLYTTSDRRLSVQVPNLTTSESVVGACSYYIG